MPGGRSFFFNKNVFTNIVYNVIINMQIIFRTNIRFVLDNIDYMRYYTYNEQMFTITEDYYYVKRREDESVRCRIG